MAKQKAAILARVSSKEQEETGYSLSAQEKLLKEHAERLGYDIYKTPYIIAESATGKQVRKIFNQMFADISRDKVKILFCEKIDRLTRNPKDAIMVMDWLQEDLDRQVHFVKESFIVSKNTPAHENLVWDMKVAIARFYANNLSEEVKKGQKEKLSQGELPSMSKIGYKTIGEKGHRVHVIDEELAPYIKKMFERYATGLYSLKSLGKELHKEGFRTRKSKHLSTSHIQRLLRQPFYYGKVEWNGNLSPGKHTPLIDKILFDRVQAVLTGKNTPKYSKQFYLLKGLVRCKECAGVVSWEKHKGITYGHCNRYRNCSKRKWVKQSEIEKQLVSRFDNLEVKNSRLAEWIRKAIKESHKQEINYNAASLKQLNEQHDLIQKRMDAIYEDRLDGRISLGRYDDLFKKFSSEKETVASQIKQHSESSTKYFELGINIYELSQRGKKIYHAANLEQQRNLLNVVFDKLELQGDQLDAIYTKPFQVLATAVDASNALGSSKTKKILGMSSLIFELKDSLTDKTKSTTNEVMRSVWLGSWDSNPGPIGYTLP